MNQAGGFELRINIAKHSKGGERAMQAVTQSDKCMVFFFENDSDEAVGSTQPELPKTNHVFSAKQRSNSPVQYLASAGLVASNQVGSRALSHGAGHWASLA